ncbi:MAG: class I SAM-dependent methyltransferase [Dehalococcoidales bacterium]|nr:MAG: class I SAM-dependent methyltransferase [Dehalococcoidales bacterium]
MSVYDRLALGLMSRFVWKCPSDNIIELYNQHVSANHLDIGVGTGYFLDRCTFPVPNPRLVLVDLKPNSLAIARNKLARYSPQTYCQNALEPLEINGPRFDSIGINYLLHCLPVTMQAKGIIVKDLKDLLNPGGILFGTTFLYRGVERSLLATYFFYWLNLLGIMTNKQDDAEDLRQNLARHFTESGVEVIGCGALFWGRTL